MAYFKLSKIDPPGPFDSIKYQNQIEFIRYVRNHKDNVKFFPTGAVDIETHKEYMSKKYKYYYICWYNEDYPKGFLSKVGWVGVDDNDIRLAVHPDFKRKGVGEYMVKQIIKLFPKAKAKVSVDNQPSYELFRKLGFYDEFVILGKKEDE